MKNVFEGIYFRKVESIQGNKALLKINTFTNTLKRFSVTSRNTFSKYETTVTVESDLLSKSGNFCYRSSGKIAGKLLVIAKNVTRILFLRICFCNGRQYYTNIKDSVAKLFKDTNKFQRQINKRAAAIHYLELFNTPSFNTFYSFLDVFCEDHLKKIRKKKSPPFSLRIFD